MSVSTYGKNAFLAANLPATGSHICSSGNVLGAVTAPLGPPTFMGTSGTQHPITSTSPSTAPYWYATTGTNVDSNIITSTNLVATG